MNINELINKIHKFKIHPDQQFMTPNASLFLDKIVEEIRLIDKESIRWTVYDFLFQAIVKENVTENDPNVDISTIEVANAHKYLRKYDANKFQDALELMIDKHDATIGITWDTIDIYLDEHCLKERE